MSEDDDVLDPEKNPFLPASSEDGGKGELIVDDRAPFAPLGDRSEEVRELAEKLLAGKKEFFDRSSGLWLDRGPDGEARVRSRALGDVDDVLLEELRGVSRSK